VQLYQANTTGALGESHCCLKVELTAICCWQQQTPTFLLIFLAGGCQHASSTSTARKRLHTKKLFSKKQVNDLGDFPH
jgi:hypothetical protein